MSGGYEKLRELLLPAAATVIGIALVALMLGQIAGGVVHAGEMALRCLLAPLALLDSVAHAGSLAGVGLVLFAAVAMVAATTRQVGRSMAVGRAIGRAKRPALPPGIERAAISAGVSGQVDAVEASRPFAFVYGWLHPRICVSTGLAERLSAEELTAALLHERWHVMHRDPLRLTVAVAVRSGFCFLPALSTGADRYAAAVEVAADRFVVAEMGHPRSLAAALLRLEPGGVAPGFAGWVDQRVEALVDRDRPRDGRRPWLPAVVLAAEVAAIALLVAHPRLTSPLALALVHAC